MTNSKKKMICVIDLGNALRGHAVVANYTNNTIEAKKYNYLNKLSAMQIGNYLVEGEIE